MENKITSISLIALCFFMIIYFIYDIRMVNRNREMYDLLKLKQDLIEESNAIHENIIRQDEIFEKHLKISQKIIDSLILDKSNANKIGFGLKVELQKTLDGIISNKKK